MCLKASGNRSHQKDNVSQRVRRLFESEGDGFLQRHPSSLVAGLMLGRDRHAKGREPPARRGSRVRGCRQTKGGAQSIRCAYETRGTRRVAIRNGDRSKPFEGAHDGSCFAELSPEQQSLPEEL